MRRSAFSDGAGVHVEVEDHVVPVVQWQVDRCQLSAFLVGAIGSRLSPLSGMN